jgi:hypothetical protein
VDLSAHISKSLNLSDFVIFCSWKSNQDVNKKSESWCFDPRVTNWNFRTCTEEWIDCVSMISVVAVYHVVYHIVWVPYEFSEKNINKTPIHVILNMTIYMLLQKKKREVNNGINFMVWFHMVVNLLFTDQKMDTFFIGFYRCSWYCLTYAIIHLRKYGPGHRADSDILTQFILCVPYLE